MGEGDVSKDWNSQIDLSVGLAFSLKAFEMYRKSGVLMAEVRSVPFVRGACQAYLELVQGKVVQCYLIDRKGERYRTTQDMLVQLDEAKGPFAWMFQASADPVFAAPPAEQGFQVRAQPAAKSPILRPLVRYLDLSPYQHWWTPQQQQCLQMIFSLVDGRRSIDELKAQIPLAPVVVDEGIRILLQLKAIAMQ
jgi:hypothetical protein